MRFDVITLFPEMFDAVLQHGVTRRGKEEQCFDVVCWNPRDFTHNAYRTVDDRPYGGGPGMVMLAEPLKSALDAAQKAQCETQGQPAQRIYLSPQGQPLTHALVKTLASASGLILLAGRYEGVDERLIQSNIDLEISLGDYVLSGGELPAMVLIDAIARQLPGVLGDAQSAEEDSFVSGLLDYPHYTRPEKYAGMRVPEVLLSGHHANIHRWRLKQALGRTWLRRPDLLTQRTLTQQESRLLAEFQQEWEAEQAPQQEQDSLIKNGVLT